MKTTTLQIALLTMLIMLLSTGLFAQALTGTKTIGSGGNYTTFTAAINALNTNGVGAGGVTFNVSAGATFAERPPAITATGTETDQIVFQKSGAGNNPVITPTGTSSSNEAGIIISGGDYITFDGIDINASAVTSIEHGYLIRNSSATNGAQHNTIKNFTVTLNRNNTTSAYSSGILQSTHATFGGGIDPTAQSGANDYNRYQNFTIQNSASGIVMYGGTFKDQFCEIGTTANAIRNTLTTLGNTSGIYSFGIYIFNGSDFTISNCDISGISGYGDNIIGINLQEYGNNGIVNNNSIRDLNNTSTSTSVKTIGFRTNHVYAGVGSVKFYNNTISDLKCASSGPTTTVKVMGASLCAYESNEEVHFYHNTISIGYGRTWDFRSAGVSNNSRTADIYMYANIVANYAAISGSSARAYCVASQTKHLSDGYTDYNLYYSRNGQVGIAEGWDASTLAAWQTLVTYEEDDNSVYGDPYLIEPNTNLHGTGSKAIGQPGYTVPAYITVDMDYEARGIPTALGADTYTPIDEDSNVLAPITQVSGGDLTSIADTPEEALEVLTFRMSDSGGDGYETKVTTVKILNTYIWNSATWTTVLQGAVLKVNDVAISTATAVITDTYITFTIPEGDFNIADGATVDCGLYIYFKTTGIVDGKTMKFMVAAENHGFTNAFWGSRLPVTLSGDIISNDFTINVIATQLRLTYPRRDLINRQFTLVAEGVDANNNFDPAFHAVIGTMSLHTGTGTLSGTMQWTFTDGDASWEISYNKYEWIKLQIVAGSITAVTEFIQINPYIEVSSGPIAGAEMSMEAPFIYNFYHGRSVALYTLPEVNGYYSIEALSWNVASTLSSYYPLPVKIYMKPYSGTFNGVNSSTTWESLISGATLVYNGSTNAMNSTGWRKLNLDTVYNNQTNFQSLLVFVESDFGNYSYQNTPTFVGNYLNSQDYHFRGTSSSSTTPSPFNVSKWQFRPHIRFWVTSQGYYEDTVTEQSSTQTVTANSTNQQIIRVNVQTGGSLSQQTINSLTFNTTGTTDVSDIVAAKVFYTGASTTFSTTTQYGATITNLGAKGTFTVSSNINVSSGNHYFWLVYDIGANPSVGDQFDAQCTAVSVNNISRIPSVTDPAGSRGVAGKKLSDVWVSQLGQGTTSSGAQNIGILQIDLYVTEGSDAQSFASLPLNSISVTGKNTNNADVQAAKLANQTNPSSFLASVSMASGTALFSNLNYELAMGSNTVYVYYDLSASAGAGNVIDAKLLANSINVGGNTYPASQEDPSGEYTIQNFNYGGGYAEQGGYYFANTLATPAPSHPTFDWIDITDGGYNSYPDMNSDDGYAPDNVTGYPIGFSFPYFGNSFSNFWIGADGSIYLTKPNLPLNMGPPANAISPYNSDFHPASPNYPKTILYKNVGGNLVVTYLKVQPKNGAGPASYATFQVILYPTGKIKIQLSEFGSSFPTNNGSVWMVNSNMTAFHAYAYGGMAGPVTGTSPIAVAYGQNAYMLGDNPAQNDLPVPASGTATISFPVTGATVQFTTATAATNLTAIRVDTNPGGSLPDGILSLANRHWTINSTATSGLGSYNLTLSLTGITNLTAETIFYLVKREHVNSAWTNMGAPAVYDFQNRTATWLINNGFSDFGLGFEEDPETLPVELSSFTATLTSQNYVNLSWISQSETGLNGYYVCRSMEAQLSSAITISPLIAGTNSSQQHVYSFTDTELFEIGTYYYWLQSNNLDGSSDFFGPVILLYTNQGENPGIPELPLVTGLGHVYPNPFNPSANISYTLKESVPVDVKVYNNKGQLIRTLDVVSTTSGVHRLNWDGKDSQGKSCSSGIYYFRMTAGKEVFTRKAILMK